MSWNDTEEMLLMRRRLMDGNQREVAEIIHDLKLKLQQSELDRETEVSGLQLLVETTREKYRITRRRLVASEESMAELQKETDIRLSSLQHELDNTRRELALLHDSLNSLVHAQKKCSRNLSEVEGARHESRQKQRDLELREVHLVDQLSNAQQSIGNLREELAAANDKAAELQRAWLQSQRDFTSLQRQHEALAAAKNTTREVEGLRQALQLMEDTNARLLHVIAQFGAQGQPPHSDAMMREMQRAKELFRYVAAVGSHHFQFLGDAALHDAVTFGRREDDVLGLQDLKHSVHDFMLHMNSPHRQNPPNGGQGIPPSLRLECEKDNWLPREVIQVATCFQANHFPDKPLSAVYALVVEVAKSLRDYSSNVLTTGEVAMLDMERKERQHHRKHNASERMGQEVQRNASPNSVKVPLTSADVVRVDHSNAFATQHTAVPSASPRIETARCVSGLRCLISQIDLLCTTSGVFKSLPASHVRDILSVTLRTVEGLTAKLAARSAAVCKSDAQRLETKVTGALSRVGVLLETKFARVLELSNSATELSKTTNRLLRNALKGPQDPTDPDCLHRRDCCASRGIHDAHAAVPQHCHNQCGSSTRRSAACDS